MLVRARGKLKTGNYLLILEECPRFGIGALAQDWGGKPWLTCNELSDLRRELKEARGVSCLARYKLAVRYWLSIKIVFYLSDTALFF